MNRDNSCNKSLLKLTLVRFSYGQQGTLGTIQLPSAVIYTLEPPWLDNRVNVSCIPVGRYTVKRNTTGRHQYYELQNVPKRTHIEIHPANRVISPTTSKRLLQGCIAVGMDLERNFTPGLHDSTYACDLLLDVCGNGDWIIDVKNTDCGVLK